MQQLLQICSEWFWICLVVACMCFLSTHIAKQDREERAVQASPDEWPERWTLDILNDKSPGLFERGARKVGWLFGVLGIAGLVLLVLRLQNIYP
jgi:hypothetical protein